MQKRMAMWCAVAIAVAPPALAQPGDDVRDAGEILRVEAELCRAFEAGDAARLREGLDERFTLVDSSGQVTGFAQVLAEVQRREPAYDVFRNHGQSVRLHGDAAVVIGTTSVEGRLNGEAFAARFRFTDTWIRTAAGWKMAASHASRLGAAVP